MVGVTGSIARVLILAQGPMPVQISTPDETLPAPGVGVGAFSLAEGGASVGGRGVATGATVKVGLAGGASVSVGWPVFLNAIVTPSVGVLAAAGLGAAVSVAFAGSVAVALGERPQATNRVIFIYRMMRVLAFIEDVLRI